MSDEDIIKNIYIELTQASINKNIEKLNELLSDKYILVHMTGMNQTKDDYINSVKNGSLKYYDAVHDSVVVSIDGNMASIVGKSKVLASPFGMSKSWWRLKQNITLEKIDGKWLIIKSVATTY